MRRSCLLRCVSLAVVVMSTASCGDLVRASRSPVLLVINSLTAGGSNVLLSDVISSTGGTFNDTAIAALTVIMKDITVAPTSSTNNRVTVNRYRVEYRRADGNNMPGVDVPHPFDSAVTLTITPGSTGSTGIELVRHVAKEEPPLVQLGSNPNVIHTIAYVTFFGTDQVGNELSVTGAMQVSFGNFAD